MTPVVDFVLKLQAVDPTKIALMGVSLGGELAPRAAAYEKRIAALIANDGVYDYGAANLECTGKPACSSRTNAECRTGTRTGPDDRGFDESLADGALGNYPRNVCDGGSDSESLSRSKLLPTICATAWPKPSAVPLSVCNTEGDIFFKGRPQELFDHPDLPQDDAAVY